MQRRNDGRERRARLGLGATLVVGALFGPAHAAQADTRVLQAQVNRLVDLGFESPQRSLAALNDLKARHGQTDRTAHRLIETGIGLVAADNGMKDQALAAVAELDALAATAGPIAHADALLVLGDLELSLAESSRSARDTVAAAAAYTPFCETESPPQVGSCNAFDWFWANMFAGLALSDSEARTSAGIYLQVAGAVAERARRPDLEARAVAVSADLAQDEHNIELSDRLLRRADMLAVRSKEDSAREFVKMFASTVLQERGDLAGALAMRGEALQIAQRAGHARRVMDLSDSLVMIDLQQGRPEQALQHIAGVMPELESRHEQSLVDLLHVDEIVALLRLGRVEPAKRSLATLLDALDARMSPSDRGDAIDRIGDALATAGSMDTALALFQRERQALLAAGDKPFQRRMLAWQAELAAKQQLQRRAEIRQWAAVGATAVALLLVVSSLIPWLRARNRRLARANDALRQQAERDPLTGLLNRDGLLRGLGERGRADAFAGTLLLVDIDHFKNINDTLGHAGGDVALQEVAARLQSCLRDGDLVVRWGGEELVVAVLASSFDADALVDRILQSLAAAPVVFQQRSIAVSASIGYGSFPLDDAAEALSFDEALAIADAGMYYAKRHGRRAAVRITRLPRELLADLGGLPEAVEREAASGAVELRVRRLSPAKDGATVDAGPSPATAPQPS